jgi:hypothetical protein
VAEKRRDPTKSCHVAGDVIIPKIKLSALKIHDQDSIAGECYLVIIPIVFIEVPEVPKT